MDGFPLQGLDFDLDFRAYGLFWDASQKSCCSHTVNTHSHSRVIGYYICDHLWSCEKPRWMSGWQDQYCACDVATKEIPIFTQKSTSSLKVWGCPSRLREQLINSSKMILVLALVTLVLPKWYWCKKYALGFAGPCAGHPGPSNGNCRWVSLHLSGANLE